MAKPDNESESEGGKKDAASAVPGEGAKTAQPAAQGTPDASRQQDAIALLKADHRAVEAMFETYKSAQDAQKADLVSRICTALTIHTILEEEIFYPACREAASDEEPLDEAQVEHDSAKMLISSLMQQSEGDRFRDAKVSVLAEQIKHHVAEEEAPSTGIFAKAQAAGLNTPEIAKKLQVRKQELQAQADRLAPSEAVSFGGRQQVSTWSKEEEMPRQSSTGRDERGRFTNDDERGGRQGGCYDDDDRRYARSRDDDDGRGWYGDSAGHSEASRRGWAERTGDRRSFASRYEDDRSYGSRGFNDRDRDEYGRFTSNDDNRGGYSSRGGNDDDRRYGSPGSNDRDRDEYGRFASDDDRGGRSYSRSRDDDGYDDRRYSSRGGRDDNGRFTSDDDDRRGGARARSRDDDDGRGWYGDSRGHAEAARRGWENRNGGGSSARSSRDDDDDRRRSDSGGGSQGGWFGDSRGHAEAARRGWENRR